MKLSIDLDYEKMQGTIRYRSNDGPSFLGDGEMIEKTFVINDENVLEAHEFMSEHAIKEASRVASELKVDTLSENS